VISAEQRTQFLAAVNDCATGELDLAELVATSDDCLSGVAFYPPGPAIDLGQAAGQVLEQKPEAAINAMMQLMSSESGGTRAVTCVIISRMARYNPSIWASMVRHLAADDAWEVREYAAHAYDSREGYSGAVEFHQEWVLEELAEWVSHSDYLLHHGATQALLGYVQVNDQIIPRLLELLNPLLQDPSDYVRTGHVIALRMMGRRKPEVVLKYIDLHLPPKSDEMRETFLQVLEHPFADKVPERKAELMAKLVV
jgi:hypothetical protein